MRNMQDQSILTEVVTNPRGVYEGNLKRYFRIFFMSVSTRNPYHNFRHVMHVLCMCYRACRFYKLLLTPREMRNLLIAALFHDFNHHGTKGDDSVNIRAAINTLRNHVLEEDVQWLSDIETLIRHTEFPHIGETKKLRLSGQILRDADLSQALDPIWLQQVIFGLSVELEITPLEMLSEQETFLRKLKFVTIWAKTEFPRATILAKIAEARALVALFK